MVIVKDPCVPHPRRVTGPACGPIIIYYGIASQDLGGMVGGKLITASISLNIATHWINVFLC